MTTASPTITAEELVQDAQNRGFLNETTGYVQQDQHLIILAEWPFTSRQHRENPALLFLIPNDVPHRDPEHAVLQELQDYGAYYLPDESSTKTQILEFCDAYHAQVQAGVRPQKFDSQHPILTQHQATQE